MALSYGFYSSINHDRVYSADQISEIFNGIITDGVFESIGDKMVVSVNEGMTVKVGSGRAWFNGTWTMNDTDYVLPEEGAIEAPIVSGFKRIDAVVLTVDKELNARENRLEIIQGTPASADSVAKPDIIDTDTKFYHVLAYITTSFGDTEIKPSMIENCIGKDDAPFITAILETTSIESLLTQWEAEWDEWLENKQNDATTQWLEFLNTYTSKWEKWFIAATSSEETMFVNWFANIKGQLSEDAAGNLQHQINQLSEYYLDGKVLYIPSTQASVTDDGILILGKTGDIEDTNDAEDSEDGILSNAIDKVKKINIRGRIYTLDNSEELDEYEGKWNEQYKLFKEHVSDMFEFDEETRALTIDLDKLDL